MARPHNQRDATFLQAFHTIKGFSVRLRESPQRDRVSPGFQGVTMPRLRIRLNTS